MNRYQRIFCLIVTIIIFLVLSGCGGGGLTPPPWDWPEITSFMTVSGTGFQDGFKFMGSNLDPWRFITSSGEIYTQEEVENWVSNAVRYTHSHVFRMHMNGGAFEPSIGTYDESSFQQLDYLLAAASKYNVYVLISLRNCLWGPWPADAYDPYWYLGGGSHSIPNKDAILTDNTAIAAYKNYIAYVLNRENTITKIRYKDDHHILGWDIINEPNMLPGIENWFSDIGSYVKSIDPNHLVCVATKDVAWSEWDPGSPNWDKLNVPQLDFLDLHYYADLYCTGNTDYGTRITQVIQAAKSLNKPLIIGEFGYPNNFDLSRITNLYQSVISRGFAAGVSGVIPYSWGPLGPNGWGGPGSFCMYTDDTEVCNLLRYMAP